MKLMVEFTEFLKSTYFIDSESNLIKERIKSILAKTEDNNLEKAKKIFYFTRDKIRYDPYSSFSDIKSRYKASYILKKGRGWCVQKACVLAALARAIKIPSRLHFADIKNYVVPEKLLNIMGTNVFVFHGYTELFLDNNWIKVTPAFNIEMCDKLGLKTVEFDGKLDAILPQTTLNGEKYIEYVKDRGVYNDFPFDLIFNTLKEYYDFV